MNKTIEKLKSSIQALVKKGAFHVVAGSFLTKFVSFFGSIFLVRCLSKSDYGILSYYENFTSYFTLLAGLGLANGVQRYMVLEDTLPEKYGCYLHALRRGNVWNCVIAVSCVLLCLYYPHPAAFAGYPAVGVALTLCIPFLFFKNTGLAALRALFDHKNYAFLAFFTSLLLILVRIAGAYMGGLNGTTFARLLGEAVGGLVCVILIQKKFFTGVTPQKMSAESVRQMNTYSFQMMLTDGLWTIFMLNDLFLLGQLCGDETMVADYKIAYVIPANLSILVSAIGIFVAPYFTKHENEKDYTWVRQKFSAVLKMTSVIMGGAVALCFLLAKPLVLLLYGAEYLSAVPIMRILLVAAFFNNGIRASIANVLSAMGEQKLNLYVAVVGILLQVSLDIYSIPRFGAVGLAWSSVTVFFMMSILLSVSFRKKYY